MSNVLVHLGQSKRADDKVSYIFLNVQFEKFQLVNYLSPRQLNKFKGNCNINAGKNKKKCKLIFTCKNFLINSR